LIFSGCGFPISFQQHLPSSVEVDMGWNKALGHAEQTGKKAGDLQNERGTRASGTHRKSTAHPALPSSGYPDPEHEAENSYSSEVRTGIVSVNGCDVGVMHCRRP